MQKLLIIPARTGSKRIPNKNFKNFIGKPLISYVVERALKCEFFDEIMVSTDNEYSAQIAQQMGAAVPFLRSAENSNDIASTSDVLFEVITNYQQLSRRFEYVCCIYPTSVLLNMDKVKQAFLKLTKNNYDSVISVIKYPHPIERAIEEKNNKIRFAFPEYANTRTQDLETKYFDAGQFYWMRCNHFMTTKKILSSNSSSIILEDYEAQDIDNPSDWTLAEIKFRYLQMVDTKQVIS